MFFVLYFFMTGPARVPPDHRDRPRRGDGLPGLATTGSPAAARRQIEVTGLYWHFVDVVWVFLYPLLYLIDVHS